MNIDDLMRRILFLPRAGTSLAERIDRLHFFVITVTMIGSATAGMLAVIWLMRFRRRGEPSRTEQVTAPKWLEFGFTGVLLSLFILWWLIGFGQYVRYANAPADSEVVYVSAKQWMWDFAYPSGRTSINVLVVPRGYDVKLVMTSRDVIHSFYVPEFRIKQDVLPGRYTTLWFHVRTAGVYDVFCAEYCGMLHSQMWAAVVALEPEAYGHWLEGQTPKLVAEGLARVSTVGARLPRAGEPGTTSLAEKGRVAASRYGCFSCHTVDGQPHIGPTWLGLFGKLVELDDGRTAVADEAYLTRSMMDPKADVVRGFRPVMPTYLGILAQPDAGAIVEYIKSLANEPQSARVTLPRVDVSSDAGMAPARTPDERGGI